MEPTSEPDHNRQARGLARFWPVHGAAAPAQRQSDEDPDVSHTSGGAATAPTSDQQAGAAGPTGEHPQVSDQQSQPQDDQQGSDEPAQSPFAPGRPHPALTSDTQMVALGSRRPADALLSGANGSRWGNQVGFAQVETNGHRNGDAGPRHGGAPIANGQASATGTSRPVPGSRSPFAPGGDDGPPAPRSPFAPGGDDGPPASRSPFAPAEEGAPADPPFAASPFAPQASGSAPAASPVAEPPAAPAHPLDPAAPLPGMAAGLPPAVPRPISAQPAASGSAQVPAPKAGRPVSAPPAAAEQPQATRSVPHTLATDHAPTRLEPSGWATAGPRAGASASAAVPVSPPADGRGLDDEDRAPAPRRAASLDDAAEAPVGRRAARAAAAAAAEAEAPLRPGDVRETSITFWEEAASEQFRTEWHEIKAQFVDDPVAALTRAHDLITEAVHELTESMLAERDDLDPLRGTGTPDTENMRMSMRGYREFLDRILAL
ncbi:hypothetical protein ACIBSW_15260 [Actinoplanes sp. NPDC049668]|uniref:hypothetical protein n=1 Tax=unclassified Actinoplanes TaxID=2626549 RepID=UPI0033B64E59